MTSLHSTFRRCYGFVCPIFYILVFLYFGIFIFTFPSSTEFYSGGIGYVEMLFRCNILALIGGGSDPRYLPNKVMIWDDHQSRPIGELSYRRDVRAVKLRRDKVVVVLEDRVYVYNFSDLKVLDTIETGVNKRGICALSPSNDNAVLVTPGTQLGHIRITDYTSNKVIPVAAHDSELSCLALSYDGSLLATASIKGTIIRVFDTTTGKRVCELRRGSKNREIYSIAISKNNKWLVASSDGGSVHVFSLEGAKSNRRSNFSSLSGILPYLDSQWSYAVFRVAENVRNIVTFGADQNSIVVVGADGSVYKALFDPEKPGKECVQDYYVKFTEDEATRAN